MTLFSMELKLVTNKIQDTMTMLLICLEYKRGLVIVVKKPICKLFFTNSWKCLKNWNTNLGQGRNLSKFKTSLASNCAIHNLKLLSYQHRTCLQNPLI